MLCAVLAYIFLFACAPKPQTSESFAMDTVVAQTVYAEDTSVISQNNQTLHQIENAMSKTLENSDVFALNQNGETEISAETAYVLSLCLAEARKTGGAFDPALGAVIELWKFGTESAHVPDTTQLKDALARSGYSNVTVNGSNIQTGGAQLDLGGAAKGYALDALRQNLEEANVSSALVAVGGSIYARGAKPDGSAWKVGIRDPYASAADYIATVDLENTCISTSGIYERGFEENGVWYHHIIDPQTGYPVDNGLISVSIIDKNGLLTDIYSTALFVMGPVDGPEFASENGIDAIFITENKEILLTDGFDHNFELKDKSYHEA